MVLFLLSFILGQVVIRVLSDRTPRRPRRIRLFGGKGGDTDGR